jgi:hypothetical protein
MLTLCLEEILSSEITVPIEPATKHRISSRALSLPICMYYKQSPGLWSFIAKASHIAQNVICLELSFHIVVIYSAHIRVLKPKSFSRWWVQVESFCNKFAVDGVVQAYNESVLKLV